jgi:hypothetical protein
MTNNHSCYIYYTCYVAIFNIYIAYITGVLCTVKVLAHELYNKKEEF